MNITKSILLIGEKSVGKTSFINALAGDFITKNNEGPFDLPLINIDDVPNFKIFLSKDIDVYDIVFYMIDSIDKLKELEHKNFYIILNKEDKLKVMKVSADRGDIFEFSSHQYFQNKNTEKLREIFTNTGILTPNQKSYKYRFA